MEEINQPTVKQSGFDQKAFIQIRLHELLSIVDKLNTNPLFYDKDYKTYNYKIIAQNLFSALTTVYSKLKSIEQKEGEKGREELKDVLDLPIYSSIKKIENQIVIIFHKGNLRIIENRLFNFRCLIEKFMDSHGFNPSKDDPRAAVLKS